MRTTARNQASQCQHKQEIRRHRLQFEGRGAFGAKGPHLPAQPRQATPGQEDVRPQARDRHLLDSHGVPRNGARGTRGKHLQAGSVSKKIHSDEEAVFFFVLAHK